MMELKKIIFIDKSTEDNDLEIASGRPKDLNIRSLLNKWPTMGGTEQLYACTRAYSYREVLTSILHEPFGPFLVIDRFCVSESEVEIEMALRTACKSVARAISLPWMTAERWDTPSRSWLFIQESGELVEAHLLVTRIEEGIKSGAFLSKTEVLNGSVYPLELDTLLQSLATSFPNGFCYVHPATAEQRCCLYFRKKNIVHCFYYDRLTMVLRQGQEALEKFLQLVAKSTTSDVPTKNGSGKFCFRFFTEHQLASQTMSATKIKSEEPLMKAVPRFNMQRGR